MPEEIEKTEEVTTEVVETTEAPSQEEVDYKALAEAEKARADAAEALIIKNKNIAKREKPEEGLTEERVLELIKTATKQDDDSPEAQALAEAQAKVKELTAKTGELARAVKAKGAVSSDTISTQRDGLPNTAPALPANSPLKEYKYEGNGIYSKKLASGQTLYKNTKAGPGEQRTWVA